MYSNEDREIEELERKLQEKKTNLKRQQDSCNHQWSDVRYDPEKYQKAEYSHLEGFGSDSYPIYNYNTAEKDRWSRFCEKCGKVEYTYEKKAVKYEPYFR